MRHTTSPAAAALPTPREELVECERTLRHMLPIEEQKGFINDPFGVHRYSCSRLLFHLDVGGARPLDGERRTRKIKRATREEQ